MKQYILTLTTSILCSGCMTSGAIYSRYLDIQYIKSHPSEFSPDGEGKLVAPENRKSIQWQEPQSDGSWK